MLTACQNSVHAAARNAHIAVERDPEVASFLADVRGSMLHHATLAWLEHSPRVVGGFEERIRQLAQRSAPTPAASAASRAGASARSSTPSGSPGPCPSLRLPSVVTGAPASSASRQPSLLSSHPSPAGASPVSTGQAGGAVPAATTTSSFRPVAAADDSAAQKKGKRRHSPIPKVPPKPDVPAEEGDLVNGFRRVSAQFDAGSGT